jgi:heme-degrading monooxygenase HmoA
VYARVTTYDLAEGTTTESIAAFEPAIGQIAALEGLVDAYYLVETDGVHAVTVTIWDTREAMERSRVAASSARTEAAHDAGAEVTSTHELEIGLHATGAGGRRPLGRAHVM